MRSGNTNWQLSPYIMGLMQIERGIEKTPHGYRVSVRVRGTLHQQRFKGTATVDEMRRWRERRKRHDKWAALGRASSKLRRAPDGWCYLYAIRNGEYVKFGVAVDPVDRCQTLQTGCPTAMTLVAAVPCHAHLERLVHRRFEAHRAHREWFRLHDEVADFIEALNGGANPVALLWDVTTSAPES